jgi:predicted flavoprotein YhiN
MTTHYDVAVIGAGAAGMMCAAVAGQRGRRVVLIC